MSSLSLDESSDQQMDSLSLDKKEEKQPEVIRLVSKEGVSLSLLKSATSLSGLVSTSLELDSSAEEIKLNLGTDLLRKVISFMEEHSKPGAKPISIPRPLPRNQHIEDLVTDFDSKLVDIEPNEVCALVQAANYMDIPQMLDLTAAKVATLIRGKTPAEIRAMFNIKNDLTAEEESKIEEETKWTEPV